MNGISLVDFAGVLTAVGAILGSVFLFTKHQTDTHAKTHEGRVGDLQRALDRVEREADERIAHLRQDFERQLTDVKQAMTHQAQVIERQEIMLSDYARHVGKLERIMAAAQLEIPDFETSPLRGGRNV